MTTNNQIKHKLRNYPDATIKWMDSGYLLPGGYDTEEIIGLQIRLMIDGFEDVYIITILPGDEYGVYDVYLRKMGYGDMIHMFGLQARDPENVVVTVLENLPDYLSELGDIM